MQLLMRQLRTDGRQPVMTLVLTFSGHHPRPYRCGCVLADILTGHPACRLDRPRHNSNGCAAYPPPIALSA